MPKVSQLVIDCSQGARKGQIANQLIEMLSLAERASFVRELSALGVAGTTCELDKSGDLVIMKDGLTEDGAPHAHEHRSLSDVRDVVQVAGVAPQAMADAMAIYGVLAQAEARAHDAAPDEVHFHEVGNDFAIATIVAVCMLVGRLSPERILATPIATGYGYVDCAHGRLPIPAPATANILEGMPHFAGDVEGELCTPTGAAIVRHFAQGFLQIGCPYGQN